MAPIPFLFVIVLILSGCAAPSPWRLESIATGIQAYDSTRLTYSNPDSPLRFEMICQDGEVSSFLSLTKYKFSSPDHVKITIDIGGASKEETIPLSEGKMRLRLPLEITDRLVYALQEGTEVVIIVDGFEQHLHPEQFAKQHEKLIGKSILFKNPFKGLFDP